MQKKKNSAEDIPGVDKKSMRDLKALASTREGNALKKELSDIDPTKLIEKFNQLDKETIKEKLKNINTDTLKKAMQNKDFFDKLK